MGSLEELQGFSGGRQRGLDSVPNHLPTQAHVLLLFYVVMPTNGGGILTYKCSLSSRSYSQVFIQMLSSCLPHVLAFNWPSINRPALPVPRREGRASRPCSKLQVFSMGHPNLHPRYHSNTHTHSRMHIRGRLNHSLTHKIMLEQSASSAVGLHPLAGRLVAAFKTR